MRDRNRLLSIFAKVIVIRTRLNCAARMFDYKVVPANSILTLRGKELTILLVMVVTP